MKRSLADLLANVHFPGGRMAFVVGPRQVGKTTMARMLLGDRGSEKLYRNWDDLEWRREMAQDPYGFADAFRPGGPGRRPLLVLDEIHRFPRWKSYLKGLWDTRKERLDVLVTGSGRLDVYQRGGDSLLGRYHQYRMHPLSTREVVAPAAPPRDYDPDDTLASFAAAGGPSDRRARRAFDDLAAWGGFPEPFLKKDPNHLRLWHRERHDLIVREDMRDLTRVQLLSHVEELVEMIADRAGGILSYSSLARDLQVAVESVRSWVGILARLHFAYLVRPYAGRISRAIRKEPKVYLWDWSEVADPGRSFENLVAGHLLKWSHFTVDWGYQPLDLHYVRDKEGREVDFLLTKGRRPWLLVEAKLSETEPGPSIHHFARKLGVKNKVLVVANLRESGAAGDVKVLDAPSFLAALPV